MTTFTKTRNMNLLAGWGFVLLGVITLLTQVSSQSIGVLLLVVVVFGALSGVALGSARALEDGASAKLRTTMETLNWGMIGFCALGAMSQFYMVYYGPGWKRRVLLASLPWVFSFILPQLININAFRTLKARVQA